MTKFRSLRVNSITFLVISVTGAILGCGVLDPSRPERGASSKDNDDSAPVRHSQSPQANNATVSINPMDRLAKEKSSIIELRWTVPTNPVDGFVVSYGFEDEPLNNRITVPLSQLEREEKTEHGPVYRYLLKDIPRDRELQVSIASYRGENVSLPSPARVIPVNEPLPHTDHPELFKGEKSE